MSDAPRIVYAPWPGAKREAELSALAAVYRIALSAKQRARISESGPSRLTEKNEKEASM